MFNPFKEIDITVIDTRMGAGKTTFATKFVNDNPERRFLIIAPTRDEARNYRDRINREIVFPDGENEHKGQVLQDVLYEAVLDGKTVVSTHQMLQKLTKETLEIIETQGYTLILDEVLELVEPYSDLDEKDYQTCLKAKLVKEVAINERVIHVLPDEDEDYKNGEIKLKFGPFMNLVRKDLMYRVDKRFFVAVGVPERFKAFDEIFIMTYMFRDTIMHGWLRFHNIPYKLKSVKLDDNRIPHLIDYYDHGGRDLKHLIHIEDSKALNEIGERETLSASFYSNRATIDDKATIRNNIVKFCRNRKVKPENFVWVCYRDDAKDLAPPRYTCLGQQKVFNMKEYDKLNTEERAKTFTYMVSNLKATNHYRHKTHMAMVINYYGFPGIQKFFKALSIPFDEDRYALSEMLQVIFRMAIRDGKEIWLYLPSARMRQLLKAWLEGPYIPKIKVRRKRKRPSAKPKGTSNFVQSDCTNVSLTS